jgi:flagellar basal body-associated protein FliL
MSSLKWVVRIVLLVLAVLALLSIPRPSASAQQDEEGVKGALAAAPAP